MAYLCISNGRSATEIIKLLEGEVYEIDRYTSKLVDSDAIRKKHAKEMSRFTELYPGGKNGAVRIFATSYYNDNKYIEPRVLYKKHIIAFNEIIKNKTFMRDYATSELNRVARANREGRSYRLHMNKYDLNGVVSWNFNASINRHLTRIKHEDKEETGLNGGGKRYFEFIRNIIIRYEEYIEKNPKHPTIDEIYKTHIAKLDTSKAKLVHTAKPLTIKKSDHVQDVFVQQSLFEDYMEYNREHDTYLSKEEYESMTKSSPYEFFESPEFDRYYGDLFKNEYMILTGNKSIIQDDEYFEYLYRICEKSFTGGDIACPPLSQNEYLANNFNEASLLVVSIDAIDLTIEYQLAMASQNKARIVIISDNHELIEKHARKYKEATIIESYGLSNEEIRDQLIEYFVRYHSEAKKNTYKR